MSLRFQFFFSPYRDLCRSSVSGKNLSAINVRKEYAVSILAIRRNGEVLVNPSGEMDLEPMDEVIVIGVPDAITRLSLLFHPEKKLENIPPV